MCDSIEDAAHGWRCVRVWTESLCVWEVAGSLLSNIKHKHTFSLLFYSCTCPVYVHVSAHTLAHTPSKDNILLSALLPPGSNSPPPSHFFPCTFPDKANLTNHPRCQGEVVFASHQSLTPIATWASVCFSSGKTQPGISTKTGIPQRPLRKKLKLASAAPSDSPQNFLSLLEDGGALPQLPHSPFALA